MRAVMHHDSSLVEFGLQKQIGTLVGGHDKVIKKQNFRNTRWRRTPCELLFGCRLNL